MLPAFQRCQNSENAEEARQRAYNRVKELSKHAKETLSLSAWFAKQTGEDMEANFRQGRHRSEFCPACDLSTKANKKVYIDDDRTWSCFACGESGSILDAERLVFGGTMGQIVERLLGSNSDSTAMRIAPRRDLSAVREQIKAADIARYEAVAKVVQAVKDASKSFRDPDVIKFLTGFGKGERGLPIHIVEEAIARDLVRTLPSKPSVALAWLRSIVSDDLLRAANLWKEDAEKPWIIYRPLWFVPPGAQSAELRIIRLPRDKSEMKSVRIGQSVGPTSAPYYWQGENALGCAVVEGVPDLLSLASMGYKGDILGISGTTSWQAEWFAKHHARRGTKQYTTMLDNDLSDPSNPGQKAAEAIGAALIGQGLGWSNFVPPEGDLNDSWLRKARRV